jgi:hypothetical protein
VKSGIVAVALTIGGGGTNGVGGPKDGSGHLWLQESECESMKLGWQQSAPFFPMRRGRKGRGGGSSMVSTCCSSRGHWGAGRRGVRLVAGPGHGGAGSNGVRRGLKTGEWGTDVWDPRHSVSGFKLVQPGQNDSIGFEFKSNISKLSLIQTGSSRA